MSTQVRFVIFGQGRTGSKLLVELLRSHPDIHCDLELLTGYFWGRLSRRLILPLWRLYPLPLFRNKARKSAKMAYGFKLFYGHVHWPTDVLSQMHAEGWKIIHIQRRDLVAQTISYLVAQQSRHWHRHQGQSLTTASVALDPATFLADVQKQMAFSTHINRLLLSVPHLDIVYEDDLASQEYWPGTSIRVLDFLELPPLQLTSKMIKTWEKPYSEIITNYAELMSLIDQPSMDA